MPSCDLAELFGPIHLVACCVPVEPPHGVRDLAWVAALVPIFNLLVLEGPREVHTFRRQQTYKHWNCIARQVCTAISCKLLPEICAGFCSLLHSQAHKACAPLLARNLDPNNIGIDDSREC